MKRIVLGSRGQLGSDLCDLLKSYFDSVQLKQLTRNDIDISQLDLLDVSLNALEFDVLVNCTSYHKTDDVEKNSQLAFLVNSKAVEVMAKACQGKSARFVHISTDYVFDGSKKQPYTEYDNPGPLNVYGASKLMGESLAQLYCENTMVLRVASLFGKRGASGKGGNFLTTIMKHAIEKGEISVVNDQWMSPTWTGDVAKMILALLDKNAPPGIYHAVNSGIATWYDLAKYACQLSDIQVDIKPVSSAEFPTVAIRPAYSVMDNAKISTIIGRIPRWQDAVKSFLHEYTLSERYC